MDRLSALDASFLAVESETTPMHVGWVATFDGPSPGSAALFEHIAGRLSYAPRFRQRLVGVPLGVHDPVWADDPEFDAGEHLHSAVRRRFRVTPNDVLLAATAGALRGYFTERGEAPQRLKAMVPADVRASDDAETGNRISFLFLDLPCDEPDPVVRLQRVHEATASRDADGTAEALDFAFRALARTPGPFQHALAQAFAHPRLFNLTVSSVPGPAVPRYLHGCRLRSVHSSVPLASRHALSIGFVTVAGQACMGITADPATITDADAIAPHFHAALDELLP